jgi:MFS family permease
VGSAFFVLLIRRHEPPPEPHRTATGETPGMRRQVAEGLRYVLSNVNLRHIAACTALANLFSNIFFAVFLVYVVRDLSMAPETIGLIFGLGNIGFLAGAMLASRVAARIGVGWAIIVSAFLPAPAVLAMVLAPRELAVPLMIAGFAVTGFGVVVYNVNQVSLRQAITPDRIQGRMNATMRFIVWGTMPIGSFIGGILGTVVGLHETLVIGALGGFLPFLAVLFSPVRQIRTMPTGPEDADDIDVAEAGGVVVVAPGASPGVELDPDPD